MTIIDLSIPIENGVPSDPEPQIPRIQYLNHHDSAEGMASFFGKATVEDLPEGNGWAIEFLQLCTHSGTHLDAPYHYYPTMNEGEPAWTIDQVPLEWCIGNGVKVDFREKPDGYKIQIQDFQDYFSSINYQLQPRDIVLINTGADAKWGTKEYLVSGCGVSYDATLWLIEQGIKVVGTDAWSWDVPLPYTAEEFNRTGNRNVIWEGHRAGRKKAYCHIEKLTNLHLLPPTGFTVSALPVSIASASAGWCRAVAILKDEV